MALYIAAPLLLAVPATHARAADLDCRVAHWDGEAPAINLRHIFCGEIRDRPDGYHSEAIFPTPAVTAVAARQDIGHGLYNATVSFTNGGRKFSTFFPRACSVAMVLKSIRHAVAQPRRPKPNGWGFIAYSAPRGAVPADGYCLGDDGAAFPIRYALLSRGDVNTAFPDPPPPSSTGRAR